MLSKTCGYALQAMIYIARQSSDGSSINIHRSSENINSPQLFIAKILQVSVISARLASPHLRDHYTATVLQSQAGKAAAAPPLEQSKLN